MLSLDQEVGERRGIASGEFLQGAERVSRVVGVYALGSHPSVSNRSSMAAAIGRNSSCGRCVNLLSRSLEFNVASSSARIVGDPLFHAMYWAYARATNSCVSGRYWLNCAPGRPGIALTVSDALITASSCFISGSVCRTDLEFFDPGVSGADVDEKSP